jgi:serine/threonine protein kinase
MPPKKKPSAESDLMLVLLGLQMNSFTKEQVVECGAILAQDRSKSLAGILEAKGYLKKAIRAALEALVAEQVEKAGGDPEKSLAALPLDEDVRKSLLGLPLDEKVHQTLMKLDGARGMGRGAKVPDAVETVVIRQTREERYRMGAEIGRGGLGRVVAGQDTILGREVAIKEMLRGADSALVKRFLREGEVAGRLMHPNIVPVFDVGVREEAGAKTPYFAMGFIHGRDLKEVLRNVEEGKGNARAEFTRPRLLSVFQDVCLAVAYAHNHGVIHRDLKPANVMVGEFGEVYVVDWGLAKVKGQKDDAAATLVVPGHGAEDAGSKEGSAPGPESHASQDAPMLTMEGDVLGTPAYMPPEQADGRIAEIDEKSDVYSLGAILYEILTFRPPFEGTTGMNVIAKVLLGDLTPPSARASEIRKAMGETRKDIEIVFPQSIPPELEAIVLKAMAKEKAARYSTAKELHAEVQRFLEGEKERERNHERALAKVAEGKILVERMEKARADMKALEKEAEEKGKEIKPHWPVEKKAGFWAAQDRVREHRRLIIDLFTEAGAAFHAALEFERGNKEARAALAGLYWNQYLREEEAGDRNEMIHYEALVREYNDGQYDARLKGDGTLTVSTKYFPCRCLTEGRTVRPDEMEVMGYHPFSGRALDGHKGAEGLPDLEPKEPIFLKVHGAECRTEALAGADVWLLRFEEQDKILVPRFPPGVAAEGAERVEIPAAILDRLYDAGSPFRPKEGLLLGRTPVGKFTIPMGSYLLILAREGFHPVRCPVYIGRLADEEANVTLYRDGEIPAGFVQVPAGKFIYQGDKENPYSGPKEIKDVEDCFVAKFPVTCREYLEFLNDLAPRDPAQAEKRAPRKSPTAGVYWPHDGEGRFFIPTEKWLVEAHEDLKMQAAKLEMSPVWWEEDWPAFSVSWEDLTAYAAWKAAKRGLLFSLSHEIAWEKAARGVDGRSCPWGEEDDATFCNTSKSDEAGLRPMRVDSFPVDESPYGVRGMAGNSRCVSITDPGEEYPGWRMVRGGLWTHANIHVRSSFRTATMVSGVACNTGGRLSWIPRCGTAVEKP